MTQQEIDLFSADIHHEIRTLEEVGTRLTAQLPRCHGETIAHIQSVLNALEIALQTLDTARDKAT